MIKNILLALIISLSIVGCADKSGVKYLNNHETKLNPTKSVYIAEPKDGRYGNKVYSGSGATTAQALLKGFAKYIDEVETANKYQSRDEALNYAIAKNYSYLVYPDILQWEDRATEWSGIPDRISIKITIIDTKTSQSITSSIINGRSGWATFGGDHPQDLLPDAVEDLTKNLYN